MHLNKFNQMILVAFVALFMVASVHAQEATVSAALATGSATMFQIQSVDTMKYSRDAARNPIVESEIPQFVEAASLMKPTHIAIGTPYDEEFYPIMKKWVDEIRKHNIKVWYRGNFSAWEGWFGRERFTNPRDHIGLTRAFIANHPDLFEPGDIFTPAPEPENGAMGDPRMNANARENFFPFLIDSYNACNESMKAIGKVGVECGYFSTNGDVAEMFTKEIVQQLGNVIVIDHYVKTPEELIQKITHLHEQTGAQVVLGEYGAPIPDIHGDLSFEDQDKLIRENFVELSKHTDIVKGVNYWTAFGGSTTLFDNFVPRPAVDTIKSFYAPLVITGTIVDDLGAPVENATVGAELLPKVQTNAQGEFRIATIKDFNRIVITKEGYNDGSFSFKPSAGTRFYSKNVVLTPTSQSLWHFIVRFFRSLFQKSRTSVSAISSAINS